MSPQKRALRTRNALLLSAAEVFERHGYARASLNEISAGAGVSRGALHFHFKTKAAMAEAIEGIATRSLCQVMSRASLSDANALQALMDLSHHLVRLLFQDVVVRAGFWFNCDTALRASCDLREKWQVCVHRLVARAAEEESLVSGVSQEDLVSTVVAMTFGLAALSRVDKEWLAGFSLTAFWQLLLTSVADPRTAAGLKPGGTGSLSCGPTDLPGPSQGVHGSRPR